MARDGFCPQALTVSRVMLFGYRSKKRERRDPAEVPGDSVAWPGHRQRLPVAGTETSLLSCFRPAKPYFLSEMSPATRQELELF